jgi:predicted ATPase
VHTSISLINYKSYRKASLRLVPLALLIGANASGKSNLIEGIRFLSWLARGQRLDDLVSAMQSEGHRIRGTVTDLVYQSQGAEHNERLVFGFDCHGVSGTRMDLELGLADFKIRFEVTAEGMRVVAESLSHVIFPGPKQIYYELVKPAKEFSHEVSVRYESFTAEQGPEINCSDQQAIFTQLGTPARFVGPDAQRHMPRAVNDLRYFLDRILFLDPNPGGMRNSSFVIEKKLKGDGSNLSSVLFDLCREPDRKATVLDFIRALPEQDIRDIGFLEGPRKEVIVTLTESFGGQDRQWDAGILSDGTLKVLAIAAALLSAPENSLVVVEEIDNGVHPSRAGMLLENILKLANSRRLRVLVTTHNPALLDALPVAAIPDVVCCYRDPEQGDSRLIRLEDVRDYPELVAQGPLGQLMTRGILDRYLKDRRSEDEKKADALRWLDSLDQAASS